jgi:hypothetical protein
MSAERRHPRYDIKPLRHTQSLVATVGIHVDGLSAWLFMQGSKVRFTVAQHAASGTRND